ncbi:hypothetical protein PtA15_16A150 [Puccinia triticina]|uniref:CxC1-like cysteine cluster associated with KDZ transposases domain-containing protein n=1 Tax=Puccinia triticina TaxID=208348 RepID=A0ABY7D641_9BASI|nr:uncharacterized protein PtA15_16A150 [Puccinia triticina]WAQ92244.1 hypothetical protein PtA15_16A150 [Puccinia triticina]
MARTRYNSDRPGTRADRLRQHVNAARNAETYTQFRQRQQLHHEQEEFRHENILDDPYNHPQEEDTSDDEENDNDKRNWVVLTKEEPVNPIDAAIKARKAQHQQQARQYNYSAMIQSLHSVYLVLKYKTNDWTGSNTFYDFRDCNCLPHTKTSQPVDLVDVSDKTIFSYLKLTEQQILAQESCPACFGPRPPNSSLYPNSTRDQLIICLDGNFQHWHHTLASRDNVPLVIPRIFIHPDQVEATTQYIRRQEQLLTPPSQVGLADLSSETDDTRPPDEHIDSLPMAGMTYRQKLKCINQELRLRLSTHKVLVQDWSDDVMWLSDAGVNLEVPDIDEELEDVLLDNEGDDGDYAEDDWVDEIGYDDTPKVAPPLPAEVAPPLPQESEARISSPVPEELNVPDRSAPSIPE